MPWDKTENEIKHRLQTPDLFIPDSFRRKDITDGISLIIGKKKEGGPMETQAIRFDKDKFTLEQAKEWMAKHKDSFSEQIKKMEDECEAEFGCKEKKMSDTELETADIEGVEIFAAGTWNNEQYSEADLDSMIYAFNETHGEIKPYLKIGHGETQALLEEQELPAAGWIENLRRVGDKLVADFKRVPKKLYDLIKAGAYRTVSAEIYWNAVIDGKRYPFMLKAVALLGATLPAVKSLKDIISLYGAIYAVKKASDFEVRAYKMEDIAMEKEIELLKSTIAEKDVALAEANAKVAEFSTKIETLEAEKTEARQAKRFADIDAKVDALIASKKIVPAAKEKLTAILRAVPEVKVFKEGEAELTLEQTILSFAEMGNVALSTEQETDAGKKDNEDIADKAKRYAAENKITYKEAYLKLKKESGK